MKTVGYIPKNGKPKNSEKPKPRAADGPNKQNSAESGGNTDAEPKGKAADGGENQRSGAR